MSAFVAAPDVTPKIALFSLVMAIAIVVASSACGTSNMQNTTAITPPPSQPSYPSTPPVAITWAPNSSPYPAPPACSPPTSTCTPPDPNGSNDFPLTVSSPTDGGTVTSPATVVASASPKNPIFFMRVYVDQLAVTSHSPTRLTLNFSLLPANTHLRSWPRTIKDTHLPPS